MKKLFSINEVENLEIAEVKNLYKNHISKNSTNVLNYFPNGHHLTKSSQGMYIILEDGIRILDFTGGNGVLGLGHNHSRVQNVRKVFNEENKMEVNKLYFSKYTAGLAYNLSNLLPPDMSYSFFPNSGAEAIDGALKLAFKYHSGNRQFVLASDSAFHGKLIGAGSLTKKNLKFEFQSLPGVLRYKFNDIDSIEDIIEDNKNKIYALVLEPYSASTLNETNTNNLLRIRELSSKYKIVLIYDEVYTGWAKVGNLMNFMRFCSEDINFKNCLQNCLCKNISPDILVLSKTLGGGKASISAFVTRKEIYEKAYKNTDDFSLHTTTYSGFSEEVATAIEAINTIVEEDYVAKMRKISSQMEERLEVAQIKFPTKIKKIHGKDLIRGIEINFDIFYKNKSKFISFNSSLKNKRFFEKIIVASYVSYLYEVHHILVGVIESEVPMIRISPSNIATENEIKIFFDSLEEMFSKNQTNILLKFLKSNFKYKVVNELFS